MNRERAVVQRWQWVVRLLTRRMWFRAALFCVFAVALALAGALMAPLIPYNFGTKIGAKSVDNILNTLAASMLAVTTFSLTAMVQAYSGATSNMTPRAVQLLIEDSTSQTALSTFLGSFLFAIVGIIALSTGFYGETGRVILYAGTIVVLVVIVVTFLRWIEHVARFGRVSDTIERVERAATHAARTLAQPPVRGARAALAVPDGAARVTGEHIGRVTHVDYSDVGEVAEELGADIHLAALPGTFVDPARPLVWTTAAPDADQRRRIASAFTVARERAYDQDPRFGLVVLSEIASRALSPAVNDPGTAVAVIEAGTRVLAAVLRVEADPDCAPPAGVRVPPFALADLLEDLYRPIARDGAGLIEVGVRLQKSLAALRTIDPAAEAACALRARDALARAEEALTADADRDALRALHAGLWAR